MSGLTLKVRRSQSKMPKIKAAFKERQIEAGILYSAGKHGNSDKSVAEIAFINEYGTAKIPERPAFRSSFAKNRKKYKRMVIKLARKGFKGKKLNDRDYDRIGRTAKNDIERSIVSGSWVANAPSTQLRKGGGKQLINDPLIDTGQMLDSVDYRVKNAN